MKDQTSSYDQRRRSLSGIYIFDKLEGDEKLMPTCIEDCNVDTRINYIKSLDPKCLKSLIDRLHKVIVSILSDKELVSFDSNPEQDAKQRKYEIDRLNANHDKATPSVTIAERQCAVISALGDDLDIYAV